MTHLQKINNKGEYTNYPGVTVISQIDKRQSAFWDQVHACVSGICFSKSERLTDFYTPLPSESYHMTAVNLFVEDDYLDKTSWEECLTSRMSFTELDDYCKSHSFYPTILRLNIAVSGSIRLLITLPPAQEKLIIDMAKEFHVKDKMPDIFHVTLGYQYKFCNAELQQSITKQLKERLVPAINSLSEQLILQPPTLCYFNTMEAYEPWDGKQNPFQNELSTRRTP